MIKMGNLSWNLDTIEQENDRHSKEIQTAVWRRWRNKSVCGPKVEDI